MRPAPLLLIALPALLCGTLSAAEVDERLMFEKDVRPILKAHCFHCHGEEDPPKGGLDLRLRRFMAEGGGSGPAIVPGRPDESYLLERVRAGEMPPGGKPLAADEIDTLARWIAGGAETARPEPDEVGPELAITPEERAFWSFQPIVRPEVPEFSADDRVRTPIDAFVLARLRAAGLGFSPDADRLTLLRRAHFDLIGLPPTPEEVRRFLDDDRPDAYERLVDELLDSPHYGERWGRHWLDVAGYADSEGSTNADTVRNHAWRYRDYVIRSFNADKPFDQFIQEQLAGDELLTPPYVNLSPDEIEMLAATGYLRMAADGTGGGAADEEEASNQVIADTIKIVSTSLLGLSVGCAQCHDHRYDPIPHADYFRLRAVFEPALNWQEWRTPPQRLVSLYTDEDRARAAEIEAEASAITAERTEKQTEFLQAAFEKELEKFDEPLREPLRIAWNTPAGERSPEQTRLLSENPSANITPGVLYQYNPEAAEELKKFDARIAEVRAKKPVEEFVRALTEVPGKVPETRVFHRGDHRQPTDAVPPGDLDVTAPPESPVRFAEDDPDRSTTGRRLAFARRLTGGDHPLVPRVLANRVWLHHFGRGIVETPADFGVLGERPTHPDLLDWLADEFVARGWSLKSLHRLIMTSTVYRQSSQRDPEKEALDSANALYWRKPVVRLDAEVVRDRILAASGTLDRRLFGPPVPVAPDDAGQIVVPGEDVRRSVYIQVRRSQPLAMLTAFDAPVMETNCEIRPSSTVATQSLMLMNSEFILAQAEKFAERVRREAPADLRLALTDASARIPRRADAWQYGYGAVDEESGHTRRFEPLPHWTGSAWQGGPELPDPQLGWVILNAQGGHAGNDQEHAAVRRWTAPGDGRLTVGGTLRHASENGDGVRGRLVSSRAGLLGEWIAQHGEAATDVEPIEVRQGDVLDFVTDCRENVASDSFEWIVELSLELSGEGAPRAWTSDENFQGPLPPSLAHQAAWAWELAYGRPPTAEELGMSLEFLSRQLDHLEQSPGAPTEPERRRGRGRRPQPAGPEPATDAVLEQRAMTSFCQVLLSSNEFLYVD